MVNLLIRSAAVVGGSLLLTAAAYSQTTSTLRLDEVVQLGVANSRQLQVSEARVAAAQAKTAQFRDQFVPSVTYNGSYYRLSDNVTPLETPLFTIPVLVNQTLNRFSLTETVFTGFRAKNFLDASVFLANATRFDAAKDQADVKLNLLNASLNLFKLQEARRVFDKNLLTARGRVTDLTNLRTQGLALDNDVLKAELAVAQLEAALAETDNAIRAAQFALSVLCNLPENTDLRIDSSSIFQNGETLVSLEDYLSGAGNTASVQAANERLKAAEKQVKVNQGAVSPVVSVGANYYYNNPNQRQFPLEDRFIGTWDVGVNVSWNLSSFYTSRHTVEEARATQLQNEAQVAQLTDAVRSDIANNFYTWQTALNKIAVADKSVASAIENQRVNQLRQGQQVTSATDLLDADGLLLQAQINAVTARVDARTAWYKLQKSAGRL